MGGCCQAGCCGSMLLGRVFFGKVLLGKVLLGRVLWKVVSGCGILLLMKGVASCSALEHLVDPWNAASSFLFCFCFVFFHFMPCTSGRRWRMVQHIKLQA